MSASPLGENGCTLGVADGGGGGGRTAHYIRAGGKHTCSKGHFVCGKWHKDGTPHSAEVPVLPRNAACRVLLYVAMHRGCTDSVEGLEVLLTHGK